MRGNIFTTGLTFGIIVLLTATTVLPALSGSQTQPVTATNTLAATSSQTTTTLTFYMAGKTRLDKHTVTLTVHDAEAITTQIQALKTELLAHPSRVKTQQLEQQFLNILYEKNVVPAGVTRQELQTLLQPPTKRHTYPLPQYNFDGTEYMCTFLSWGEGTSGPFIILPRLIPIIELPIPRIYMHWTATDYAVTSCGALNSEKGFTAEGPQKGTAIGFWGIGFTVHFPPMANMYGLIGYALYAHVSADYMEYYPPNRPPEITGTDPADGQVNVPVTTSELRFQISDADSDLMSYNVTTSPDIGSGSGGLKPDGLYSIPVSGLQDLTNYTWHITVTDGKATTEQTLTFRTVAIAPIITNPAPANGERDVSPDLSHLRFHLQDYQGDAMEYTVQTQPNIGSDHQVGVHDGTYSIPLSGVAPGTVYHWFINATDGTHWTRKVFGFSTGYPSPFDPFEYGWHYYKQLTIDHTQVVGDLQDFQVLVSLQDPDLSKAQANGMDLLFMDSSGPAKKLHHDIESFEQSTGTLIAWVNVPLLSSDNDTTICLYYGNPTSIDQRYPEKTWNADYLLVYHMNDGPGSLVNDMTGNYNNGKKQGTTHPTESIGMIGKAQFFTGDVSCYIQSSKTLAHGSNPWTYQCWYRADRYGHSEDPYPDDPYAPLVTIDNGAKTHFLAIDIAPRDSKDRFRCFLDNHGVSGYSYTYSLSPFDNQWHQAVVVRDNSAAQFKIYIDGQPDYTVVTPLSTTYTIDTAPLSIGAVPVYYPDRMYFEGYIDEIQVSTIARSPQWISTSFNNQNDPSAFYTVGPEVYHP